MNQNYQLNIQQQKQKFQKQNNIRVKKYKKIDKYKDNFQTKFNQNQQNDFTAREDGLSGEPIRITINDDYLRQFYDLKAIQYVQKVLHTALGFVRKLIKLKPTEGNNIFSERYSPNCSNYSIPEKDKREGIPNSDLHLYIGYFYESNKINADAVLCSFDRKYHRPNFGRVRINIKNIQEQTSSFKFQNHVQIIIHELIHILGFSIELFKYWINPSTGKEYGQDNINQILKNSINIRGLPTQQLSSKYVLETSRKYFGCDKLQGLQLENQGQNSNKTSHWERTILLNEIMTSSSLKFGNVFSIFSAALLKDTGFYTRINENLISPLFWGKGKGCDFIFEGCLNNKNEYREYKDYELNSCSYNYEGFGYRSKSDNFIDQQCGYINPYANRLCIEDENKYHPLNIRLNGKTYDQFSYYSRCFISNVTDPTFSQIISFTQRCYPALCFQSEYNKEAIYIQIQENISAKCFNPGETVDVFYEDKSIGNLVCPEDFDTFCGYNPYCPNHCSQNGMCVNGLCHCNEGFSGKDCSQQCPFFIDQGQCVERCPYGKYANPNNECLETCPKGYFTQDGLCQECDFSCSQCSGPSAKQCLSCQYLTFLLDGLCVEACPIGYKTDNVQQRCVY